MNRWHVLQFYSSPTGDQMRHANLYLHQIASLFTLQTWYMLTYYTAAWWYTEIMKRIPHRYNHTDYYCISTYTIGMQTVCGMHLLISKAWEFIENNWSASVASGVYIPPMFKDRRRSPNSCVEEDHPWMFPLETKRANAYHQQKNMKVMSMSWTNLLPKA